MNIYACKQINKFIGWVSEESIKIVNLDQYIFCIPHEKKTPKNMCILFNFQEFKF